MRKLVWGIPIRLFHWVLFGLISFSFYTGEFGDFESIDNHMIAGYGVIGLVIFRIIFGLVGHGHIRFTEFVRGPSAIVNYIKHPTATTGHNPLGALAIIALLTSLGIQAGTGLFTTDEIFVEGPLYHLVNDDTASLLSQVHSINRWILLALISLHLCAVAHHEIWRKEKIVGAMFHGKKETGEDKPDQSHQIGLAVVCGLVATAVVWYGVNHL